MKLFSSGSVWKGKSPEWSWWWEDGLGDHQGLWCSGIIHQTSTKSLCPTFGWTQLGQVGYLMRFCLLDLVICPTGWLQASPYFIMYHMGRLSHPVETSQLDMLLGPFLCTLESKYLKETKLIISLLWYVPSLLLLVFLYSISFQRMFTAMVSCYLNNSVKEKR